ncbi:hypothetical protein JTB14_021861 [Gonioctena quinquepunctata]|nr:hypothetical protein JTB14_021861 [Gonioctena quinquepunctata]
MARGEEVTTIYIEPLTVGLLTDEDSGEKDGGGESIDNVSSSQLRAAAEIQVGNNEHIGGHCLRYFESEEHLCYDESMLSFERPNCKQSIRGKPIRFVYKMWWLNNPSGYLMNFEMYQGPDLWFHMEMHKLNILLPWCSSRMNFFKQRVHNHNRYVSITLIYQHGLIETSEG